MTNRLTFPNLNRWTNNEMKINTHSRHNKNKNKKSNKHTPVLYDSCCSNRQSIIKIIWYGMTIFCEFMCACKHTHTRIFRMSKNTVHTWILHRTLLVSLITTISFSHSLLTHSLIRFRFHLLHSPTEFLSMCQILKRH